MGTKNNPGRFDCYAAADPDEPMFVLLARDKHAAALVNLWAAMRRIEAIQEGDSATNVVADVAKILEAEQCANAMIAWRCERRPESDPSGVRALAEALAVLAEQVGAVVTIEQEPLRPLAMRHYTHKVTVRPKR